MKQRHQEPPQWMLRMLRAFCPPYLFEEIEGDLIQRFNRHARTSGSAHAKRKLLFTVVRFFRPGILFRNHLSFNLFPMYMLANYLKTAVRVMIRSKAFTAINISGLALGITGALLLFLWVAHEFSFEQFHENKDRIHIAWNRGTENGQVVCWSVTPRVLAPTLQKEFASIEKAISVAMWGSTHLFTVGENKFLKTSGIFTDPAFLEMLSFPLVHGEKRNALSNPNGIVVTESFAKQLFGDRQALGETVTITQGDYKFEFSISGILRDLPANTDFKFEYIIPFSFLESIGEKNDSWGNNSVMTLVQLTPDSNVDDVNAQIRDIEKRNYADSQHIEIFLYPLSKNHLYSRFENGVPSGGRIDVVRMLAILGMCVIIIACINFINLSTARAQRRCKEVAVRKVTGAMRISLIGQFLSESILLAVVAGLFSVGACYLLLPSFNSLVEKNIPFQLTDLNFWGWFVAGILTVGLVAGSYPALYLSSFIPVRILKGTQASVGGRSRLRSGLVVIQFGFATMLIVSAIVIYRQINFVNERETGYSRDNLLYVPLTGDLIKNFASFKNELKQKDAVISLTKTSGPLTQQWSSSTGINWNGKNPEERTDIERIWVDDDVTSTIGVSIVHGRDFDLDQFPTDSTAVLINETALRLMGFTNPIGEKIIDQGREWHIIGVVKDFVFTSPFIRIEPIILFGSKSTWAFNYLYLKLNPSKPVQENLATIESVSKKYNPDYPFEFQFADLEYQKKFDNMRGTLLLTMIFTGLAIFIACLGLLGLAVYMTEVRQKEIGIRKVMGGTTYSITRLLSFASLKPIFVGIILFSPMSWFAMNWWLNFYVYRTTLDMWIFVAAAGVLLIIALITVSTQTIRAAKSNPVNCLRSE